MPKAIDRRLLDTIKNAYMNRSPKPTLNALAKEFGVSGTKVRVLASEEKWSDIRKAKDQSTAVGAIAGAKAAVRASKKVDPYDALMAAIADISAEVSAVEAKSKEGCANALGNLLKVQRELYPPSVEELAEIAVKLNISPADFLRAIKDKWQEKEQLQKTG